MLGSKSHSHEATEGDSHHDVGRRADYRRHVPHDFFEAGPGVSKNRELISGEETRNLTRVARGIRSLIETSKQNTDTGKHYSFALAGTAAKVRHPVCEQTAFDVHHLSAYCSMVMY